MNFFVIFLKKNSCLLRAASNKCGREGGIFEFETSVQISKTTIQMTVLSVLSLNHFQVSSLAS